MIEINDYTVIISTIIIVVGWFVNSWLNRRHEISKKRLDYRLKTLHSFLPVHMSLTKSKKPFKDDKELNKKLQESFISIQLYGNQEELTLFLKFIDALEGEDNTNTSIYLNKLMHTIKLNIRKELELPKVQYN